MWVSGREILWYIIGIREDKDAENLKREMNERRIKGKQMKKPVMVDCTDLDTVFLWCFIATNGVMCSG